jgi:cbb3-type cytochrome oxidase subunit 3
MNNWTILGIQSTIGLVLYTLIFFWYVQPRLSTLPFEKAVLPLLLLHVFRFAGFALLVVGQVDPSLPRPVMSAIAYGDLLAGISALMAAIALRGRSSLAMPLIWLFTFIGVADIVNVGRIAITLDLFNHDIGTMWFVSILFFPTLLIAHIYIVYRLINKGNKDLEANAVET